MYWKKVYELPLASRGSRGRPIINLLPLSDGEKVNAILPIKEFIDGQYELWVFGKIKNENSGPERRYTFYHKGKIDF